jgi:hypothetical protein
MQLVLTFLNSHYHHHHHHHRLGNSTYLEKNAATALYFISSTKGHGFLKNLEALKG